MTRQQLEMLTEAECVEKLRLDLDGRRPDALFLFVSPHHRDAYALTTGTPRRRAS